MSKKVETAKGFLDLEVGFEVSAVEVVEVGGFVDFSEEVVGFPDFVDLSEVAEFPDFLEKSVVIVSISSSSKWDEEEKKQ